MAQRVGSNRSLCRTCGDNDDGGDAVISFRVLNLKSGVVTGERLGTM